MPKDPVSSTVSPYTPNSDVIDEKVLSQKLGFDINDNSALEKTLFTCINEDNRSLLLDIFEYYPSSTTILQILLTTTYPNRDNFYRHDQDIIADADELLGPSLENLNAIQIATLLGEEDLAIDILEFVTKITDEIEARKVLYEFMGRVWGEGNTILHLASFMGMCELVTQLIELGAATSKGNNRKYKPVDCAGDDETRQAFETVVEVNPTKRKDLENSPSINDIMSPRARSSSNLVMETVPLKSPVAGIKNEASGETKTVSKNSSTDSLTTSRPRADSDSKKVRSKPRSGTLSKEDKFQSQNLIRSNIKNGPTRVKKGVRFDPGTLLLHLCQHFDHSDFQRKQIYECLGLSSDGTGKFTLDVNNTYSFQQWLTPLHVAASHGHLEIVKLLVEKAGAAVNIFDKEGWTPLHCACAEGHLDVINYLCRCQGNIALPNEGTGKDWVYCLDGPIDLVPENDDGDKPEDVGLEGKETDILKILCDFKFKYPPPERDDDEEELVMESSKELSDPAADAPLKLDEDYFANNLKRAPSKMRKSHHHHVDEDDDNPSEKELKRESAKKPVGRSLSSEKLVSKPAEPTLPQKEVVTMPAAATPDIKPGLKSDTVSKPLGVNSDVKPLLDTKIAIAAQITTQPASTAPAAITSKIITSETPQAATKPVDAKPAPIVTAAVIPAEKPVISKSAEISKPTLSKPIISAPLKDTNPKPSTKPKVPVTTNTPAPVTIQITSSNTKPQATPLAAEIRNTFSSPESDEPFPSSSPKSSGKLLSVEPETPNRIKPRKGSWGRKDVAPKTILEGTSQHGGEQMKRPQLARRSSKSGQRPSSIIDPADKINPADQQAEEPDMKRMMTVKERMAALQQNQASSGSKR